MRYTSGKDQKKIPLLTISDMRVAVRFVICLYGVFLSAVFPFVYRNNYIDINSFKYIAFTNATYVVFGAFAGYLAIRLMLLCFGKTIDWRANRPHIADIMMLLFFAANALACVLSENPQLSFAGLPGRKTGLNFLVCVSAMYFMFRFAKSAYPFVKIGLAVSGALVSLLAVINFLGFDPLRMYRNLVPVEHEMFISTIGNRNFFGGFICVCLPIAAAAFVFSENRRSYLFLPSAFLGFAAIIAGRSDLAYAGIIMSTLALFLLSLRDRRAFSRFLVLSAAFALAALASHVLYGIYHEQSLFMYPSFTRALLTHPRMESILLCIFCAAVICAILIFRFASQKALGIMRRAALFIVIILAASILGLLVYYSTSEKMPPFATDILKFDDNFGNFRGYIWIRAMRLFKDFDPLKKMIGLGPDMFKSYAQQFYKAEMIEVTRAPFDNCHNEYLQYLMTSGIVGLFAYLGALSAALITLLKRVKTNAASAAPVLAALIGYAAQSFFNVNQPMTTPFVFLLIALAINENRW